MTSDQVFTRSEAIRITGKSAPTIDAYLKAGKLPNATSVPKGKSRSWQIPLTDLVAAGLLDKTSNQSEPEPEPEPELDPNQVLLKDIQTLREMLTLTQLELSMTRTSLDEYKNRETKLFQQFTNVLETKQAQEARRAWWRRSSPKQVENQNTSTPEQD